MPASPLRPGFGPTLPALLRGRLRIGPRAARLAAAALAAIVALGTAVALLGGAEEQLVHEGDPVFNLVYDGDALRSVDPRAGELARLEGRRGRVAVAVTVKPLRLPAFDGDVAKGLLPVHAQLYLDRLRARDPTFAIRDEGRSTVNDSPGYQVAYRTGPDGRATYWREIFVVPDEAAPRLGVVLTLRNRRPDRISKRALDLTLTARSALRSFRFGTERG
jgi:hypothetical protein